ncbi:hypothetical protein K1719_020840 [Acacia pycnantha]|nr:hypothetical protein K1719_020840 [Acacia pycnantha]
MESSYSQRRKDIGIKKLDENQVAVIPEPDPVDVYIPDPVDIPNDVLVHIFKRLPIKSILQLRCVSKHLGRIINGRHMVAEHLQFSQLNPLLLFQRANARYDELDLSRFNGTRFDPLNSEEVNPLQWQVCVVGCVNGLLSMALDLGDNLHHFVLWNPEIKHSRAVSNSTCVGQCVLGFGFNKRDIDYKIMMLSTEDKGFVQKVEVFSLYFKQFWRTLDFGNSLDNLVFKSDGETITGVGVVVWRAHSSPSSKNIIVLFDTAVESFRLIDLPPSCPWAFDFKFIEYQERVAFRCTPMGIIVTTVLELERHEEVVHDIEIGDDGQHALAEMILHCRDVNTYAVRMIGTHRFQSDRFIFKYVKSLVPVFQTPEEA